MDRRRRGRLRLLVSGSLLCAYLTLGMVGAHALEPSDWPAVLDEARGQRVYFHAWGGDAELNSHLGWVAQQAAERFELDVRHIKLADTSSAISRLLAEAAAGNAERGSADLLWLTGENFAALKNEGLLYGPWAERTPNFPRVEADRYPEMREDFGVATDGFESPWTRSQLVFLFDSERVQTPPRSMPALLAWARDNPSEFTYPRPPAFLGTTFLKQALIELATAELGVDAATFSAPVGDRFATLSAPLWAFLDALHPKLLRRGRHFPQSGAQLLAALNDREVSLAFAFNPNEVVSAVSRGELPESVESYVFDSGTLSNVSFVAVPFNAPSKAGALVLANFLLSPEVQFRAAMNPRLASEPVLALAHFEPEQRAALIRRAQAPGAIAPSELARKIQEPHPSWTLAIEREWQRRYGGGARQSSRAP